MKEKRPDAPAPRKDIILPPITADHLDHFVHPGGIPDFEAPFLPPTDQQADDPHTYAANGYSCVRVRSYIADAEPHPAAFGRVSALPWADFETLTGGSHDDKWRPLEDARPLLFKFPARPIWENTVRKFHLRKAPLLRIGNAAISHLPLIQLLARLPRAELYLPSDSRTPIRVRFRYGEAILAPLSQILPDHDPNDARLTILRPRHKGPNLGGGLR